MGIDEIDMILKNVLEKKYKNVSFKNIHYVNKYM